MEDDFLKKISKIVIKLGEIKRIIGYNTQIVSIVSIKEL